MLAADVHARFCAVSPRRRQTRRRRFARLQIVLFGHIPRPMSILISVLLVCFVLVALLMILVILMQRPKSEGLGAAFGGGVTENIFGAQTTNVLTKTTGWLAGAFFALTFALSILYAQKSSSSSNFTERLKKNLPPPVTTSSA